MTLPERESIMRQEEKSVKQRKFMYVKAANGLTVRIPAENYDRWKAEQDKLKAGEDEPDRKMLEQLRSLMEEE